VFIISDICKKATEKMLVISINLEVCMQLSDRIRKIRQSLKCSQLVFSKALGISRGHISNIETGTAVPSEQLINLICATWAVDKNWLVTGQGEMRIGRRSNITVQEGEDLAIEEIDRHRYDALTNNLRLLSAFIKNYTDFFDKFALSYEANFDTLLNPGDNRNQGIINMVSALEKDFNALMKMIHQLTTVPPDDGSR
jgi:transcriptional regulator with XRE-family HTH domain